MWSNQNSRDRTWRTRAGVAGEERLAQCRRLPLKTPLLVHPWTAFSVELTLDFSQGAFDPYLRQDSTGTWSKIMLNPRRYLKQVTPNLRLMYDVCKEKLH
ncbi:hypothetical protein NXS19_011898 [Fusarium pseudograminearum]|nr:hypothetical protein NXS19_011898 [Fusarium pseudograminearum]